MAKKTSSTSAESLIDFLELYIHFRGILISIRVDLAFCFTRADFEYICDSHSLSITFCTVAGHRFSRLVEKLVPNVKSKLQTMSSELPKPSKKSIKIYGAQNNRT